MTDKIINLTDRKKKPKENSDNSDKIKNEAPIDFAEQMELNRKNTERVAKERANANKEVKRSHKLKPNDPKNKR